MLMTRRFRAPLPRPIADPVHETWGGERVQHYGCRLGDLAATLPLFTRRPFVFNAGGLPGEPPAPTPTGPKQEPASGAVAAGEPGNRYRDLIVREPPSGESGAVPVAVVSKRYELVQHREVAGRFAGVLATRARCTGSVPCEVRATEYGSRLHVSALLPPRLWCRLPGEEALQLRVNWLNTVDGSESLRVWLSWMRLVCSNGLRVPVDAEGSRHRHVQSLELDDIDAALTAHLAAAAADSERWTKWIGIAADPAGLGGWADTVVAPAWGVVNAARVLHILRTGFDARRRAARPGLPANLRPMEPTYEVPGSAPPNGNLFRVAQALAWVAKSPTDMSHRFERELQIDPLLGELAKGVGAAA